jgi:general secretion pathway protein K
MRGERGLALVAVLWGLAVLSLIAAAMLTAGATSVRMSRNAWSEAHAQSLADAGVYRAIVTLLDTRADHKWRTDSVPRDFTFDGEDVRIAIQSEMGLIDVNFASKDQLQTLLKLAGAEPQDAETLAGRIVDWRTPAGQQSLNGASNADYRDAGLDYLPRGGPFQSVDEVNLVLGMTPDLFARLAPALTVYSHQANFDMNTAPLAVLLVVPGMDQQKALAMIAARTPPPQPANTALGADYNRAAIPSGQAFAIRAEVQSGPFHSSRDVIVELTSDPAHPFWILDWK